MNIFEEYPNIFSIMTEQFNDNESIFNTSQKKESHEAVERFNKEIESLLEYFPSKDESLKHAINRLVDIQTDMHALEAESAFLAGFKVGAQLMLEVAK